MIAQLSGIIADKDNTSLILVVGGIGFKVFAPTPTIETAKEQSEMTLYTHLAVHDDRFDLFGFAKLSELKFFQQLIKVRDVGPKSALSVLSIGNLASVQNAIMNEDAEVLMSIPGIGKKTAERIILELKEKVFTESADSSASGPRSDVDVIVAALQNLGYSAREARKAAHDMPKDLKNDDERLRWVLKRIGTQQ